MGYVLGGRAELHLEGKTISLAAGDSWTVSKGASHTYVILEPFTAVDSVFALGGDDIPQPPVGPTPTVTLPAGGSAGPITATAPTGRASAGPATFFTSGQLNVSTQGTTGTTGSVTSSTNIQTVNTSGQEVFTAASASSTCTASEGAVSGSTTINGGTLQTDGGDDDPTNTIPDHPPVNVTLPANPAPNTSYEGHIHVNSSTDNFRYVFNEQVVNPDGSITVNVAHEYLLGPTAVGELIVGQSVCGVTAPPDDVAPAAPQFTTPATAVSYDNNGTFPLQGTAEPGSLVRIFEGSGEVRRARATSAGNWAIGMSGILDGPHVYKAKATDGAGNTSVASAGRKVVVDSARPSGTVRINGGAASTTSRSVTLTLTVADPMPSSAVSKMRFRNENTTTWSGWRAMSGTTSWTLSPGTGTKKVFAQFQDRAGNVSAATADAITYRP